MDDDVVRQEEYFDEWQERAKKRDSTNAGFVAFRHTSTPSFSGTSPWSVVLGDQPISPTEPPRLSSVVKRVNPFRRLKEVPIGRDGCVYR